MHPNTSVSSVNGCLHSPSSKHEFSWPKYEEFSLMTDPRELWQTLYVAIHCSQILPILTPLYRFSYTSTDIIRQTSVHNCTNRPLPVVGVNQLVAGSIRVQMLHRSPAEDLCASATSNHNILVLSTRAKLLVLHSICNHHKVHIKTLDVTHNNTNNNNN